MKPQGNRVGNWTGRNARPQRTIGTEEEAKAESCGKLLPEYLWSLKSRRGGEPGMQQNPGSSGILEKSKARQGSRRANKTPRMANAMN